VALTNDVLLGCDAVWTRRWIPTFRRNMVSILRAEDVDFFFRDGGIYLQVYTVLHNQQQ